MSSLRGTSRLRAAATSACTSSRQSSSALSHDGEVRAGNLNMLSNQCPTRVAQTYLPQKNDRDNFKTLSLGALHNYMGPASTFASQGAVLRSSPTGVAGQGLARGFHIEVSKGKNQKDEEDNDGDEQPQMKSGALPSVSSFEELEAMTAAQLELRDDGELLEDFRALDLNKEEDRAKLQAQLAISSKRQQKLLLDQAMRNFKVEYPSLEEEMDTLGYDISEFEMSVVNINRTCKSTKAGGLFRYSAIVVTGDGKGLIGYALAKGPEPQPATSKAYRIACKRLQYFSLFENQTIWHETTAKFCKTKVVLLPARTGTGLRCNKVIGIVCKHLGIKDIIAKVIGSHDPHNTLHATFLALQNVIPPDELSELRGRAVEVY